MLKSLVLKNRSYRRFKESHSISRETLLELVDLARLTPSARNHQPLKYFISWTPEMNNKIFSCLGWAGYLEDWKGPAKGEKPSAYIVVLGDTRITREYWCDHGIASQTILLGAVEKGLGGCMIGTIDREKLGEITGIEEGLEILLVLALGKPAEKVFLEDVGKDKDIKYWRDNEGAHHVPKRKLEDILAN